MAATVASLRRHLAQQVLDAGVGTHFLVPVDLMTALALGHMSLIVAPRRLRARAAPP
jgi:hypothetical protein